MSESKKEPEVNFWCMRHGVHENNVLTDLGVRQVRANGFLTLADIPFRTAIWSGAFRTLRTTVEVMQELGQVPDQILQDNAFGFEGSDDASFAKVDATAPETVAEWLDRWGSATMLRDRMMTRMSQIVRGQWLGVLPPSPHVFVASHTPLAELGWLEPRTQPPLKYGDIVRYRWALRNTNEIRLVETTFHPCPRIE